MFWGCIVTESKPYKIPSDSEYELLHLSNAALGKSSDQGKTYFMLDIGQKTYTLGCLQKDKVEMVSLDIFVKVSQKVKITVVGKGELHMTGYFEVADQDDDEKMLGKLMDEDFESEEEELVKGYSKKHDKAEKNPLKKGHDSSDKKSESDSENEQDMEEVDILDDDEEDEDEEIPPPKQKKEAEKPKILSKKEKKLAKKLKKAHK